jgi:hypothetical protein
LLRQLLLLFGLMFGGQTFLDLTIYFRTSFRVSLLFLTGNQGSERDDGWEYLFHGDD